jgi:hypothetical protein
MTPNPASLPGASDILGMRARVPDHVVHRQFAQETVVLNLQSGTYHRLNASGGRFIEVLDRAPSVAAAAEQLATELGEPLAEIRHDIASFCAALSKRSLLTLERTQ